MIDIYHTIPHRPPFLFIDEIVELTDTYAVAKRVVKAEEPQFEGHYPGNPIMPGVLLSEAVFQTAAVYMIAKKCDPSANAGNKTPVLARIKDAKFKQMVKPGDEILIEATYKEALSSFHFMTGKITKNGKVVMTIEYALALLDA